MLKGVNVHSKFCTPNVPISTKDLQNGHYIGSFTSILAGNYSVGVYKYQTTVNPEPLFLKTVDVPLFAGKFSPFRAKVLNMYLQARLILQKVSSSKTSKLGSLRCKLMAASRRSRKKCLLSAKTNGRILREWKTKVMNFHWTWISANDFFTEHMKNLKVKAEIWRALDPSPYAANNSSNNQVEYDVYCECTLSSHKSGIISTKIDIADIGSYQLRVEFNGRPINQPPLSFKLSSGPIDPISCVVKGRKILTGNEAKNGDMQIEARDKQGNRITSGGKYCKNFV